MSWAVGWDSNWNRHIGYGVPALCDHPECAAEIDRGLAYVCGGQPYGGDAGCGLYFCGVHQYGVVPLCARCVNREEPFDARPDVRIWIEHKLTDDSWREWRDEQDQQALDELRAELAAAAPGDFTLVGAA